MNSEEAVFTPEAEPAPTRGRRRNSGSVHSRAAFYALFLKQEGYSADEAAALVVRRYPSTRFLLKRFIGEEHGSLR